MATLSSNRTAGIMGIIVLLVITFFLGRWTKTDEQLPLLTNDEELTINKMLTPITSLVFQIETKFVEVEAGNVLKDPHVFHELERLRTSIIAESEKLMARSYRSTYDGIIKDCEDIVGDCEDFLHILNVNRVDFKEGYEATKKEMSDLRRLTTVLTEGDLPFEGDYSWREKRKIRKEFGGLLQLSKDYESIRRKGH